MKRVSKIIVPFLLMIVLMHTVYGTTPAVSTPAVTTPAATTPTTTTPAASTSTDGTAQAAVAENPEAVQTENAEEMGGEGTLEDNAEMTGEAQEEVGPEYENTIGKVVAIKENREDETGIGKRQVQVVEVEIIRGDYIGEEFSVEYVSSYDGVEQIKSRELELGDKVQVQITEGQDGKKSVEIQDVVKTQSIYYLLVILIIATVAFFGKKCVNKLIILAFTIVVVYFILIKSIYNGVNVILITSITSLLLIVGNNLLLHGLNGNATTAMAGNVVTVFVSGIMISIFGKISNLTGMIDEAMAFNIGMSLIKFDLHSLIFVVCVLASVGMALSISNSLIHELEEKKKKDLDVNWKDLFKAGIEIGRNNLSANLVTYMLIYIGFALTPILLFMTNYTNIFDVLSKEMIAENFVIGLVIMVSAIISTVLSALIYSFLSRDKVIYSKQSKNRLEGKRSLKL